MPCKITRLSSTVTIIECTRSHDLPTCDVCKVSPAKHTCAFPLHGKREGEVCGRSLCASCTHKFAIPKSKTVQWIAYCGPHHRLMVKKRLAALEETNRGSE